MGVARKLMESILEGNDVRKTLAGVKIEETAVGGLPAEAAEEFYNLVDSILKSESGWKYALSKGVNNISIVKITKNPFEKFEYEVLIEPNGDNDVWLETYVPQTDEYVSTSVKFPDGNNSITSLKRGLGELKSLVDQSLEDYDPDADNIEDLWNKR